MNQAPGIASRNGTRLKEEEYIELMRARDRKGLEGLYQHYSGALYGVIYSIVQHAAIAEDLLQEAFVKIWQNFASYDESKGRLYTWMLNIARNQAIDKARTGKFAAEQKIQDISKLVNNLDAHQHEELQPAHIGLKQIVDGLRPEQKVLVDLIYFLGFSQSEAAAHLNIPLGTVKTRIRAAMGELRKLFSVGKQQHNGL